MNRIIVTIRINQKKEYEPLFIPVSNIREMRSRRAKNGAALPDDRHSKCRKQQD